MDVENRLKQIKERLDAIESRNKKVELDKAWETSIVRRILIAILTYSTIVLFFHVADLPKPFINAIVPSIGFVLSTLTIGWAKKFWIRMKNRGTK